MALDRDRLPHGAFNSDDNPFRSLREVPEYTVDTMARADWKETAGEHVIWMDTPGMKGEDLKIEVEENQVLRIRGHMRAAETEAEAEFEEEKWHRLERSSMGMFWRVFRLPGNVDMEGIRAHLENGALKVTVPKLPQEKKNEAKLVMIEEGTKSGGEDLMVTRAQCN